MPFVNKDLESVLIVAFYKKMLSTICSGSLRAVPTSHILCHCQAMCLSFGFGK